MTPIIELPTQWSVLSAIQSLDARLLRMVESLRQITGREPGADPFRGLYVSPADVEASLSRKELAFPTSGFPGEIEVPAAFAVLGNLFTLSIFELHVLLVALAADVDSRYERIYGYLQDDVSRRRPGIDLILNLLCNSAEEKLERRAVFRSSGALVAHRLIRVSGDEQTPWPRREVSVDSRIASFLIGEAAEPIAFVQRIRSGAEYCGDPACKPSENLLHISRAALVHRTALALYFRGADEQAKQKAAAELANTLDQTLLIASLTRVARRASEFESWLQDLEREALLQDATVYCAGFDALPDDLTRDAVMAFAARLTGVTILSGTREWRPGISELRGVITVDFPALRWPERRSAWSVALSDRGICFDPQTLDSLAECFHFTRSQIDDVSESARNAAAYHRVQNTEPQALAGYVFEAARAGSGHELRTLTRKVVPSHGWADIVLCEEAQEQLREICRRVTRRYQVFGKWGFERKLSGGKGVNALFHGHSGTGKTMAAEVIASALGLDLYKIDLAGVVSKYIGETEKNLDRIFAAAETANAILFFDEADALFGKRSEVRDSHDRYANLEISYLLQKMEQYEGVAILATNLRQNLDDAFLRRLTFTVQFPFPDESSRRRIWDGIWPAEAPLAPDVDNAFLAARFLLSGGNIRNVALAAAFFAVEEQTAITLAHVLKAVRAECHKLGKILTAAELAPPAKTQTGVAA